jgi:hypothetical protein
MSRDNRLARNAEKVAKRDARVKRQKVNTIPVSRFVPVLKATLYEHMFQFTGRVRDLVITIDNVQTDEALPIDIVLKRDGEETSHMILAVAGVNEYQDVYDVQPNDRIRLRVPNASDYKGLFTKIWINFNVEAMS